MTTLSYSQSGTKTSLCPYDIGDVYITVSDVNPSTRWDDTTWELISSGTFLMAAGTGHPALEVGGSNNHSHLFGVQYGEFYNCIGASADSLVRALDLTTGSGYLNCNSNAAVQTSLDNVARRNNGLLANTSAAETMRYRTQGKTSSESSLPPYVAAYMWKRTGGGQSPCKPTIGDDALCGLTSPDKAITAPCNQKVFIFQQRMSIRQLTGPAPLGLPTGKIVSCLALVHHMTLGLLVELRPIHLPLTKFQAINIPFIMDMIREVATSHVCTSLMGVIHFGLTRFRATQVVASHTTICHLISRCISGLEFHNRKAVMA